MFFTVWGEAWAWVWWAGSLSLIVLRATFREVVQYSASMHTMVRRKTVAGIERRLIWSTLSAPLTVRFEQNRLLTYPLSISALAPGPANQSVNKDSIVFRAALIGLMASGHLEVRHVRDCVIAGQTEFREVRHDCVITAVKTSATPDGALDRAIFEAAADWQASAHPRKWPEGPRVYDLVRVANAWHRAAVELNVRVWPIGMVADDTMARGLARHKRMRFLTSSDFQSFGWDKAHIDKVRQEQQIADQMSRQFAGMYPDISCALDEQIYEAMSEINDFS